MIIKRTKHKRPIHILHNFKTMEYVNMRTPLPDISHKQTEGIRFNNILQRVIRWAHG